MTALRPLLLGAALALLSALPARADVTYATTVRHAEAFRRTIAGLPPRYRQAGATVHEIPGCDWSALDYYAKCACLGLYLPTQRSVWLRGDQTERDLCETLVHELSHDVYDRALTNDERAEWSRFFEAHKDWMPSRFARELATEGFAWSAEWLWAGKPLQPDVRERIEKLLGARK